jgi:hypothetical protein
MPATKIGTGRSAGSPTTSTVLDLEKLGRDAANELADALDRSLIDIGDDIYLFEELERERFFHDRDAAAEIWTTLYREEQPELVRPHARGEQA